MQNNFTNPFHIFNTNNFRISFEFFPVKANFDNLIKDIDYLKTYNPEFISVTYGAGGKDKDNSFALLENIDYHSVAAHLTCVAASKDEVINVAQKYQNMGINHIVALRGDPPGNIGGKFTPHPQGFKHSAELVSALKDIGIKKISVAAFPETHPEATSSDDDIFYLKEKLDRGADQAICQYFFDPYLYLDFVERCKQKNINKPIIAGIIMLNNYNQVKRFSKSCQATIPNWLDKLMANDPDNSSIGTAIALEQIRILAENGIRDFHIYSLNKKEIVDNICKIIC